MRMNRTRKHRVEVALNDKEYDDFIKKVTLCGLTKQAYLLLLIKDRVPQPRPSEDFQEVIKQLRRIGININQLTIVANKTSHIDILKFNKALEDLNHEILEIRKQVCLPKVVDN